MTGTATDNVNTHEDDSNAAFFATPVGNPTPSAVTIDVTPVVVSDGPLDAPAQATSKPKITPADIRAKAADGLAQANAWRSTWTLKEFRTGQLILGGALALLGWYWLAAIVLALASGAALDRTVISEDRR